jgi:alcohol dehydrogenase (cytochrome c)
VLAGGVRAGDNLYTCTILALNADTGAIVWFYQASPHDTHDWDAVETPVLFTAEFQGRPRKLLAQASRNGYFFVLDRTTGKNLLTAPFVPTNWAKGIDTQGRPIPNPAKEPQPDGALVTGAADGGTNWASPSFDPETGLFYVNGYTGYSLVRGLRYRQYPERSSRGRFRRIGRQVRPVGSGLSNRKSCMET